LTEPAPSTSPRASVPEKTDALYQFLVDSLTDYAVFAVSANGLFISWNVGAQHTFGYREDEVIGRPFDLIFTPEDIASGAPQHELTTALSGEQADHDRWHVRKNGSRFWGTNTVQPMYAKDGTLLGFTKLVRDITERHMAVEALSDSEQSLRLLIESVHEYALFSLGLKGDITSWNVGAENTLGYPAQDALGKDFSLLFTPEDVAAGVPAAQLSEATSQGACSDERWLVRHDGSRFLASGTLTQLKRGPEGVLRGFVKVAHDITERQKAADELRHRAFHDALTKLPNRPSFIDHLQRAIAYTKRHPEEPFAVLFADLDHFKEINDVFGHAVADQVLERTARRLKGCVRPEDIVARLGGDEFIILLNGVHGLGNATGVAERIRLEMAKPFLLSGHQINLTMSVGIALGSPLYTKSEQVLHDADTAMYAAKAQGRACCVVFDATLSARRRERQEFKAELRGAIERQEFRVEYQPIVLLESRRIIGFESLVRWQHPRRGLLQPTEFIPEAEELDLVVPIDRWVLREACLQLRRWEQEFATSLSTLGMSVNFSSKQFSTPNLVAEIRDILKQTRVDSSCVRIELREGAIMDDSERTSSLLSTIRGLGVELYVSDFGVGYWSLKSLQHLPASALKIGRAFVMNLASDGDSTLVRALTSLAHNLGLKTIAEGVETEEQLRRLISLGCNYVQGFLFSKPVDARRAAALLARSGYKRHATGA
jgi:diguanylate cyclase (GGDEF)-like protein/PAS domain S-box-containing protein